MTFELGNKDDVQEQFVERLSGHFDIDMAILKILKNEVSRSAICFNNKK